MRRGAALLTFGLCLILAACEKSDSKATQSTPGVTPTVEQVINPSVVVDPTAGDQTITSNDESLGEGDNSASSGDALLHDFRPDADQTFSLPNNLQAIDPRSFLPSGSFVSGAGKLTLDFKTSNVLAVSDGRMHRYGACAYPFAAPGKAQFAVTLDGNLSEWPASSVIAIDRAGDGPHGEASHDLRAVLWTADDDYYYMGFEMAATWPTSEVGTGFGIYINFRKLFIPSDNTTLPRVTNDPDEYYRVYIRNEDLHNATDGTLLAQGVGPGQTDYSIAASGRFVEFRIDRSLIDSKMSGAPVSVLVSSSKYVGHWEDDYVGPHILGLIDDYACMVPVPDQTGALSSAKMLVMRRSSAAVSASDAENVYRSMIAAVPEVTLVAKDDFDTFDSFSMMAIDQMAAAGVCSSSYGIFMDDDINDRLGNYGTPYYNFFVAAHEYLHHFNATDYALPVSWGREGHSDWMASKAMASYYGSSVSQALHAYNIRSFQQEETNLGVQTIAQANWGEAPYTSLFYYRKSSIYWDLLSDFLDYEDLLANVLRAKQSGINGGFADSDALLAGFRGVDTYTGGAGDIVSGWFGSGNYADSILPLSKITDTDGDGLFNYQEARLGTDPTKADTDGDGYSDLFEHMQGLNPLVAQPVNKLAADNLLADWEQLAASKLKTISSEDHSASCDIHLQRHGVVYTDTWLNFAADLTAAPPAGSNYRVVYFIYEPGETPGYQVSLRAFADYVKPLWSVSSSSLTPFRPLALPQAYTGKSYELAYNFSWLRWESFPIGTTYKVGLLYDDTTWCDFSGEEVIIQAL